MIDNNKLNNICNGVYDKRNNKNRARLQINCFNSSFNR